jgi:RNA polymerase sigma-70 factor (ECF subfamily)
VRVASSEAELLRTLHEQHARALWSYVFSLTGGDRGKAEDVVQETMLRAWRHPDVLDQSRGSSRAWLFTVARRLVIDGWRSAQQRTELTTADPPEQVRGDGVDDLADRAVVSAAIRRLSLEHREVLLECYYRGSSVAQAAERLQIPAGTVKSRTHYALHALRLALAEIGGTR